MLTLTNYGGFQSKIVKKPFAERCLLMIGIAQRRAANLDLRDDVREAALREVKHWRLRLIKHQLTKAIK
jgi:hypothetical protein